MSESQTFSPTKTTTEQPAAYREVGLTQDEFSLLLGIGHPGGSVSLSQAWIEHAYPLQQITVQVQGTRHMNRSALIDQLETVIARLRAGDERGCEHDDDFGYRFELVPTSSGPSFFDTPAGSD